MKKLTFITLVLLILLTGCSKADKTDVAIDTGEIILNEKDRSQLSLETEPIVEDTDDAISFSAGKESVTIDGTTTEKASNTTKSTVSTTKIPATDTVKSETTKNTDNPKDTKVPENTTKAIETTFPNETTSPPVTTQRPKEITPPETTKPAETASPETIKPVETTTAVETEPPTPKSAYDMPFDIERIRSDLISYGQSLGFRHRTSYKDGTVVTPDNSSWEIPIVASSSFNGEALKRSLYDYVSSYVGYEIYGGEPITDFTIYIRPISGGYEIYFLH